MSTKSKLQPVWVVSESKMKAYFLVNNFQLLDSTNSRVLVYYFAAWSTRTVSFEEADVEIKLHRANGDQATRTLRTKNGVLFYVKLKSRRNVV